MKFFILFSLFTTTFLHASTLSLKVDSGSKEVIDGSITADSIKEVRAMGMVVITNPKVVLKNGTLFGQSKFHLGISSSVETYSNTSLCRAFGYGPAKRVEGSVEVNEKYFAIMSSGFEIKEVESKTLLNTITCTVNVSR